MPSIKLGLGLKTQDYQLMRCNFRAFWSAQATHAFDERGPLHGYRKLNPGTYLINHFHFENFGTELLTREVIG